MKKYSFLVLTAFLLIPFISSAATLFSQSVTLTPGWNIVSTPRLLDSHSFSAAETSANFDIYVLDASQPSQWATMAAEGQSEFTPLTGYFIDNKTGTNQTLTFNYLASTTPNQQLFSKSFSTPGWYSVGIANPTYALPVGTAPSVDTNNPSKILNALNGFYDNVVDFTNGNSNPDSIAVANSWQAVVPSDINLLNDFRETKAYAMHTSLANAPYDGFQNSNVPAPVITSFTASPASVVFGSSTALSWSVNNATTISIDQGIGAVTGTSTTTSPSISTTYTLTATNNGGSTNATTTVTVTAVPIPASLTVANDSSPTSQTIVAGGSGIHFATIQLDATQSGENVRLSSIPLTLTTTDTVAKLSSCQLWNGSTALNTGSYVINGSNLASTSPVTANFQFNNSLTIPAGTVVDLSLTCNLSSFASANATYSWAAASTGWSATGVASGSSITIATPNGAPPIMTVAGSATLAVSTDPSSPSYTLVPGGSTGVTLDVIKLHASNEAIYLQKLGLVLTSGAPADLTQLYVYAGNSIETTSGTSDAAGTLLGTLVFTGNNTTSTSTLSQVIQLPVNTDSTLVIKGDVANIGTNQPGTEGALVAVDYLNSQGTGANSGSTINVGTVVGSLGGFSGGTSAGIRIFKTIPTVAAGPAVGSNPNGSNVALKKFSITAGSAGGIGLYQLNITMATSNAQVTSVQLHAYTDSGYSQPANVPGTTGGQFGGTITPSATQSTGAAAMNFQQSGSNVFEIGAGQTVYFTLTGTVAPAQNANNWTISATLDGDSSFSGMAQAASVTGNFIWSPNATTTASATISDWTNSYGVNGLPSTGL